MTQERLLRRGLRLEYATLAWNVVVSVVLLVAAAAVGSLSVREARHAWGEAQKQVSAGR